MAVQGASCKRYIESDNILNYFPIVNKEIDCLLVEMELNDIIMYVGLCITPDANVRNFCDHFINILEALKPHN